MEFDSHSLELVQRLALALAIGLLIGIERGWRQRDEPAGGRTAGIRTFSLIGLLGGASAALHEIAGPLPLAVALAALTGAFALFAYREGMEERDRSVTGVVAAILVFVLGALAVLAPPLVAFSAAVAAAVLLAAREALHGWLERLTWPELRAGLLLLAMTFIALPVLPDEPVDPWGAVNLRELWLLTILIAAISAAGYAAIKIGGPKRGPVFASLAGGLVSSIAVTVTNARRAKEGSPVGPLVAGALIASAMSLARTFAIAAGLAPELWPALAWALVPAALVCAAWGSLAWWRVERDGSQATFELENPVELKSALRFGLALGLVLILSKLASDYLGHGAFLGLAAVTGLADVDPITLAATRLAKAGALETAALGILIAVVANCLVKITIGAAGGNRAFAVRFGLVLVAALLAGAAGLALGSALNSSTS